jgi:hypothetical protein
MSRDEMNHLLDIISGVLIRCFLLTFALLLTWFLFFLLGGEQGYRIHSQWFDLSRRDYDLLSYYGMAFMKISAILFFLFPYVAVRLVLRKSGKVA